MQDQLSQQEKKRKMSIEAAIDAIGKINRALDIVYIANHHGYDKQTIKAIEEYSELIQAIIKFRTRESEEFKQNIVEEIADSYIMTAQLVYLLDLKADDIEDMIEAKLKRERNRIKNEKIRKEQDEEA